MQPHVNTTAFFGIQFHLSSMQVPQPSYPRSVSSILIKNFAIRNLRKPNPSDDHVPYLRPSTVLSLSTAKPFLVEFPTLTSPPRYIHTSKPIFQFQMNQPLNPMCNSTSYDAFCAARASSTSRRAFLSEYRTQRARRVGPLQQPLWRGREEFNQKRCIRTQSTPLI